MVGGYYIQRNRRLKCPIEVPNRQGQLELKGDEALHTQPSCHCSAPSEMLASQSSYLGSSHVQMPIAPVGLATEAVNSARAIQKLLYINLALPLFFCFSFPFFFILTLLGVSSLKNEEPQCVTACIAHRGVTLCSIVLRGHSRRNF